MVNSSAEPQNSTCFLEAWSDKLMPSDMNLVFSRSLVKSAYQKFISYFSTKTYVVGTQKNRLNETVLLSTKNIC